MHLARHHPQQCNSVSELEQRCQPQLQHIVILEKKLAELLKSRGSLDPAVRGARVSLRDSYEDLILTFNSPTYAADVEQALWRLHYRGIEEFRTKIRNLSTSPSPRNHNRGNRRNGNEESLLRVINSFKGFLDEASGYFHGLIVKLRAKYELPPSPLPGEGLMCMKATDGLRHCAVSCHRLLIYLGDLARYKELFAVQNPNNRDWTIAANYYKQAAALCPSSGNPHNQLAVLATYTGDILSAIYHYCRSLAVDAPFITARENLILLFEKKRQHVCKVPLIVEGSGQLSYLIAAAEREGAKCRGSLHLPCHKDGSQAIIEEESNVVAIKELWECFQNHLIQVFSAIFRKSCLEELEDAVSKSEHVLQQLFSYCITDLEMAFPPKNLYQEGSGILGKMPMLKIIVIIIFLIHETYTQVWNVATTSGTSSISILFRFCLLLVSLLVKKTANFDEKAVNFLLPGVVVFMEWVASQSSVLKELEADFAIAKGLFDFKQEAKSLSIMFFREEEYMGKSTTCEVADIRSKATIHQTALWEDYELLGFSPLAPAQEQLDFSNLCLRSDGKVNLQVHLQRFMNALKAFTHCIDNESVNPYHGSPDEEIECDPKRDGISVDHMCNLKETTVILDGNPTSSLRDWIQPLNKNLFPDDLPLVSDQENAKGAHEDTVTVQVAVEEECQGLNVDGHVSLEPKSLSGLPENFKREVCSVLIPADSVVDTAVHPLKPINCSQNERQLNVPWELTQECFLQSRQQPVERAQEASFFKNDMRDPVVVYHGPEVCDGESAPVAVDASVGNMDHPPSPVRCPQDGKQSNIPNLTQELLLQTRQDPMNKPEKTPTSNNYGKYPVNLFHGTKVYESQGKRTSETVPKFTATRNFFGLKSFSAAQTGSYQCLSSEKTRSEEDLKWLDDYTHIKPAGLKISCEGFDYNSPIISSGTKRKRAQDGTFKRIFHTQEIKQYESQNPFVTRLNGQFLQD